MRSLLLAIICAGLLFGCETTDNQRDSTLAPSTLVLAFTTLDSTAEANDLLVGVLERDLRLLPGFTSMMARSGPREVTVELQFEDSLSGRASHAEAQQLVLAFCIQHPEFQLQEKEQRMQSDTSPLRR